ncbi:MAG TPA: IS630 family transposase [Phycisphaerae bacterium]|nr:IS630 family transposase [Phycisphaerae bacterium]
MELEARRRVAKRLLGQGLGLRAVARAVGASPSSVKRWSDALEAGGPDALKAKPHPGRRPWLSLRQKERLRRILLKGARKAGYATDLWTCPRVAEVIAKHFGVRYHPDHVWRILRGLGWTCQKPERRARERDEAAIRQWRDERWPDIKKRPSPPRQPRFPG